jgi:STE24 endopeptidase
LTVIQLNVVRVFPGLLNNNWAKGAGFIGGFLFILLLPTLVPLLLGLRSMPDGPLRDRLESAAQRIGVRYRDLYVWDTRDNIATAMVAGLIPNLRPIVFTDLLIRKLREEEVEAVFGHEVGHVRHGHLLYYMLFVLVSFLTLGAIYRVVELSGGIAWLGDQTAIVLSVVAMGCYLFLFFGLIWRRCERQADVFGCKAVSCADPACVSHGPDTPLVARGRGLCRTGIAIFIRALEQAEELNGSGSPPTDNTGRGATRRITGLVRFVGVWLSTWQHGTIAKRIEFLKTLDAQSERRFQWRVTAIRWGVLVLLLAGIVGVALWSGWQTVIDGM